MLSMSDIKVGTVMTYQGAPFQVVKAEHSKQARSAAVLRVKMKNLISGAMLEQTFQGGDAVEEADLVRKPANYQYREGEEYIFMDNDTYDQFTLSGSAVGETANYIKEGEDVQVMYYEGKPVSVDVPPKVALMVTEAPPGVRGDSAGNVTKTVKLETGYEVNVPMFINEGEKIRINTETGEYVERVND